MVQQIFLSPQVKIGKENLQQSKSVIRSVIISNKVVYQSILTSCLTRTT